MGRPNLRDLPPEAVEKLKSLGHFDFQMLAIDAGNLREADVTRDFPTDPLEAPKGVWETFKREPEGLGVGDDHLDDIHDAIRVVCLVLGRETDLDAQDCRHLWSFLDRAEGLLRWRKKNDEEMRQRMYKVMEAQRADAARRPSPAS